MVLETTSEIAFLLSRLVFGGVLAFMGLNHFLDTEEMAGYADANGVPYPKLGVLASGAALVFGGVALAIGILPIVAAALIVAFFLVVTPMMHDFWNIDDAEQRQQQLTHFLKNTAMAGGAILFAAIGGAAWPLAYSL